MTTIDFVTELFLAGLMMRWLKGVRTGSFYRCLDRAYEPLFPNLPDRTWLFCLFNTYHY